MNAGGTSVVASSDSILSLGPDIDFLVMFAAGFLAKFLAGMIVSNLFTEADGSG
jgi:hypothetical protein